MYRTQYPVYSERETIANALAHRDWSRVRAKVRLGVSERIAANVFIDLVRKGLLEPSGGRGWRTAHQVRESAG